MNNKELENQILQVPIEDILPNRFQPRLSFDDISLQDLAASIKEHGIIQPLVLRRKNDKYEIIAGERRFKAAKLANLTSVPAVISNLDDNQSVEVAIVENIQRKDLTSIEEARSYQALLDKGYMTQEELARKMGLSQSAISNKLRLLTLDESIQEAILGEKISERHARTLLKVAGHDKQKELLNKVINERLTVKQLEDEIKKISTISNDNLKVNEDKSFIASIENELPEDEIKPIKNIEDFLINPLDINALDKDEKIESLSITPDAFFSNPEKMPNKFFNFLEDTAVNMNTEEVTPTFQIPTQKEQQVENLLTQTDNIEMLDDFFTSDNESNDYLNDVINTIRNLNLDTNKVLVEEINLPNEYHINIVIKKD